MNKTTSKLVSILGAPASGKSTLASSVHTELKKSGKNSIFISEVATDYIAEYGIPNDPIDQLVIFYKQLNKERMFIDSKDYIICDSSSLLNYFYFRRLFDKNLSNKDIATINHLQKEILKSLSQWSHIFFAPTMNFNIDDGVRFQNQNEIVKLDRWIKSYLELENIEHIDLTPIELNKRSNYIIDIIK
jgi:nicotinamide riboside kinase